MFLTCSATFSFPFSGARLGNIHLCSLVSAVHEVRRCHERLKMYHTLAQQCISDLSRRLFCSGAIYRGKIHTLAHSCNAQTTTIITTAIGRMHLNHLGVQPFTYRMKKYRADNLVAAFPQYNKDLLTSYSQASPFYNAKDLWM